MDELYSQFNKYLYKIEGSSLKTEMGSKDKYSFNKFFIPSSSDIIDPLNIASGSIVGNLEVKGGYLQSANFVSGSKGWKIDSNGDVDFNDGTFRGTLEAGDIYIPNQTSPLFSVDSEGNAKVKSLSRDDFHWFTVFESLDGYYSIPNTGSITPSAGIYIVTGSTSTDFCQISYSLTWSATFQWSKRQKIKFAVSFIDWDLNQNTYLVRGGLQTYTGNKIGFSMINGSLYGIVAGGTSYTTILLDTIYSNNEQILEAVVIPNTSVVFNVNGVMKATITTGLPSGTANDMKLFNVSVQTEVSASVSLSVNYYDFWQAD